jgi:hypothetical protein
MKIKIIKKQEIGFIRRGKKKRKKKEKLEEKNIGKKKRIS